MIVNVSFSTGINDQTLQITRQNKNSNVIALSLYQISQLLCVNLLIQMKKYCLKMFGNNQKKIKIFIFLGYYDRQDSFSLGDLSIPMLLTAFVAAFLASLVGSSLASNISRMASLEFKAPEPIAIRAIPIGKLSILIWYGKCFLGN